MKLNEIGGLWSFVMQDDILLQTLTPRGSFIFYRLKFYENFKQERNVFSIESFLFSANFKLSGTKEEKIRKVHETLNLLQLDSCADTLVHTFSTLY